jgi:hypothetical protein
MPDKAVDPPTLSANITGVEHRLAVTFDQEHHCTSTVVRAEEGDSDRQ